MKFTLALIAALALASQFTEARRSKEHRNHLNAVTITATEHHAYNKHHHKHHHEHHHNRNSNHNVMDVQASELAQVVQTHRVGVRVGEHKHRHHSYTHTPKPNSVQAASVNTEDLVAMDVQASEPAQVVSKNSENSESSGSGSSVNAVGVAAGCVAGVVAIGAAVGGMVYYKKQQRGKNDDLAYLDGNLDDSMIPADPINGLTTPMKSESFTKMSINGQTFFIF
eukprot:Pgem_evm2s7386